MLPPLGVYWSGNLTWTANPNRCLTYFGDELDRLADDCIVWMPYTEARVAQLLPICLHRRDLWLTKAQLINFGTVEFYYVNRVLRQFGLHQMIPVVEPFNADMHSIRAASFSTYVDRWNQHRFDEIIGDIPPFDRSVHANYMLWYGRMTRCYISPTVQTLAGVVVPIRRPAAEPADQHSMNLPMFQSKVSALRIIMSQTLTMAKKCAAVLRSNVADPVKDCTRDVDVMSCTS